MTMFKSKVKPICKWVGSKRRLLPEIAKRLPENFENYYEPFVGAGSVLSLVLTLEGASDRKHFIGDVNWGLICCYLCLQNSEKTELLIGALSDSQKHHQENGKSYWMDVAETESFDPSDLIYTAFRQIFLTKTSFNGLYRVNKSGKFNVPWNQNPNCNILDEPTLRGWNTLLSGKDVSVKCERFVSMLKGSPDSPRTNDFVYLDPPYIPISQTSSFTTYSKGNFCKADHEILARICKDLNRSGVKFLLSNSDTPLAWELWKDFKIETVEVYRGIGGNAQSRKKITELLIRNYE